MVTCPTCHKKHLQFKVSKSRHTKIAECGQVYDRRGIPVVAQFSPRPGAVIEELPVRELSSAECRDLAVRPHTCSAERRRAYLFNANYTPAPYFSQEDAKKIQAWLAKEPLVERH